MLKSAGLLRTPREHRSAPSENESLLKHSPRQPATTVEDINILLTKILEVSIYAALESLSSSDGRIQMTVHLISEFERARTNSSTAQTMPYMQQFHGNLFELFRVAAEQQPTLCLSDFFFVDKQWRVWRDFASVFWKTQIDTGAPFGHNCVMPLPCKAAYRFQQHKEQCIYVDKKVPCVSTD